VATCVQPDLQLEKSFAACTPDRPLPVDSFSRRFHDSRMVWTLSVPEAAQAETLALAGQPWSYLRLKAYGFIRLCEGAYGDSGGSALTTAHRA
jgi:hypothetical protein